MRSVQFPYATDETGQGFFWPASAQKRGEWLAVKRSSPAVAEATYQCAPGSRQGGVFVDSDFAYYDSPLTLPQGIADPEVGAFVAKGDMVVQAWDTAFSATSTSDHSVCVTALLMTGDRYYRGEDEAALGPCESHYRVLVLDIWKAKLTFADLPPAAKELCTRWRPRVIVIENKAYGVSLIENLTAAGLPVEAVDPVLGKRARAVEGIGAGSVQGWFRLHRVLLPANAEWVPDYVREMKDFTGDKGGKDDQVDATVHLVDWAIRNGGGTAKIGGGWEDAIKTVSGPNAEARSFEQVLLGGQDDGDDPLWGRCGACRAFDAARQRCGKHAAPVSALHGCEAFDPRNFKGGLIWGPGIMNNVRA